MAGKKICFSDTELAQMFSDYVNRMQGEERHTAAACKEDVYKRQVFFGTYERW